jgi:hypothetical protein
MNDMNIVKIQLRKVASPDGIDYYPWVSFKSSFEIGYLGQFLKEFGNEQGLNELKKMLDNIHETDLTGNCITLDKLKNGNIVLTDLYDEDTLHLQIASQILLRITQMYVEVLRVEPLPKEIVIKLDHSMLNPIIESIY